MFSSSIALFLARQVSGEYTILARRANSRAATVFAIAKVGMVLAEVGSKAITIAESILAPVVGETAGKQTLTQHCALYHLWSTVGSRFSRESRDHQPEAAPRELCCTSNKLTELNDLG